MFFLAKGTIRYERYDIPKSYFIPKGGKTAKIRYERYCPSLEGHTIIPFGCGEVHTVRLDLTFTFHLEGDAYMVEAKVIDGRPTITMILDEDGEVPATLSREVFDVAEYIAQTCYMDECANIDGNDTVH